ncbi:PSD1 and planctomycete cytochrome C domain-containing protein [Tautonia sociabilis]|uniref:DUF1553 domain-containing protein n=1 Tax=Tautonia sociabilis TaxID=2080755 RepID=A0A432MGL6_9BACT|nr:PSD1 and planctomycete cytochrome C domain-containing protein [Tautonia sociabilis]RUL85832.1 DUF1553 domain-containing protein [Tautonia sociabilis]
MRRSSAWIAIVLLLPAPLARGDGVEERSAEDFFETTIRPLLVDRCQSCHGRDDPEGGLALTSREAILSGGDSGPAAVAGSPGESFLVEVIGYESEPRMPPKGRLSDAEIAALSRWIELGLPWPGSEGASGTPAPPGAEESIGRTSADHWAFQPVRRVNPPEVEDWGRGRSPIDRFVIALLEENGLGLAPEADRRTLIRRLSLDLTGLPPSPEEVEAFLDDESPEAYERLVDRLIASPHFGEQWARHWLDVARYSDTKGYVYGREESAWVHAKSYRDWVVRALNEDLPYDRFLLLQVAADRAAEDPRDLAAMGFLTIGRRFLGVAHDIIDDRIDVVTRGMLGLTVACARCHDHKYDPIPTADYYALYGVFRNSAESLVPAFSEEGASDPEDSEFETGLRDRQAKLAEALAAKRAEAAARARDRVADYLRAQFSLADYPDEAFSQILTADDLIPASVHRWKEALWRAGERGDPVFLPWVEFSRIPPAEFADRAAEVSRSLASAAPGAVNPIVAQAFSDPPSDRDEVADRYGEVFRQIAQEWERLVEEAEAGGKPAPEALPDPDAEAIRLVLFGPSSPCEVPDEPLVNIEFFFPTATTVELWRLQGEVDRWLIRSPEAPPFAGVLVDRETMSEPRVFRRGNPANPGEVVPRRFLQALDGPEAEPFQIGSGRLELARKIVAPENPLTARVAVNRVWMHLFGEGLVRTPGDFGTRAEPPSHPGLLDWLASRFVEEGWSLKWLIREIVSSSVYRQSSGGPSDPAAFDLARRIDPENRLLWRKTAHRLTFEELRDALLAASGELDRRIGGSAEPMFERPFPTRRSLYGRVDRQDLPTVLRVFDFANPDLLVPERAETTVPQQALFFLNHPFVLGRAQALASREEVATAGTPEEAVRRLSRRTLLRDPTPAQLDAALAFVRAAEAEPIAGPPPTAGAWRYGFGQFDEETGTVSGFRPLPYFSGEGWQGGPSWPDPALGWVRLTAEGGHPGNDRDHAAVRRWIAPRDATIQIRSTLIHEVAQGDGIRGFLAGDRLGLIQSAEVHDGRAGFDVEALDVRAGDAIDFVVDVRDTLNSDQFLWAPVISEVGPAGAMTWDARTDFVGEEPPRLGPWEQLAQVLLMSTEFSYVD